MSLSGCYRCRSRGIECKYPELDRNDPAGPPAIVSVDDRSGIATEMASSTVRFRSSNAEAMNRPDSGDASQVCDSDNIRTTSTAPITWFAIRAKEKSTHRLVLCHLSALVRMLESNDDLPPFVHWSQKNSLMNDETSSLYRARAIVRKLYGQSATDQVAGWKALQSEMERIWLEYDEFSPWELLGAIQALLVYAIVRATEPTPEDVREHDLPLLVTMSHVAREAAGIAGRLMTDEAAQGHGSIAFQDWVFCEAHRRTVTVCRVLNMVVDISHAVPSVKVAIPGFVIAPLPTAEESWLAGNASEWKSLYEKIQGSVVGMNDKGELIELGKGETYSPSDLAGWCARSGRLGFLVAAAASTLWP
jgi:hypothetical protein